MVFTLLILQADQSLGWGLGWGAVFAANIGLGALFFGMIWALASDWVYLPGTHARHFLIAAAMPIPTVVLYPAAIGAVPVEAAFEWSGYAFLFTFVMAYSGAGFVPLIVITRNRFRKPKP